MKKSVAFILVLVLLLFCACKAENTDWTNEATEEFLSSSDEPPISTVSRDFPSTWQSAFTPPEPVISYSDDEPDHLIFENDGNSDVTVELYVSNFESSRGNYIHGEAAEYVINQLKKFKNTKKEGPKVPECYMDWKSGSLEIITPIGDYCIENLGDRNYRILQLNRKTGKTTLLEPTDENFISNCFALLNHWPYDKWYGRYSIEDNGRLEIEHRYKGITDVSVKVLSIKPKQAGEDFPKMVLELTSKKTKAYYLSVYYAPSGDNIDADAEEASRKIPITSVNLAKGFPLEIEVPYSGAHPIKIKIDNTVVELDLSDYSAYAMEKYEREMR